jgi:electron transport complex protein RnfG
MSLELKMVVVLALIGIVSGGILALTYVNALPLIQENQAKETSEAVLAVIEGAVDYEEIELDRSTTYYAGMKDGETVGYAVLSEGSGYQGKIRIMTGYNADLSSITGLQVLENVETPGLGNRIVGEDFRSQYVGVTPAPLVVCIKGEKTQSSEIEAITGATVSSKAVTRILNEGLTKVRNALGLTVDEVEDIGETGETDTE